MKQFVIGGLDTPQKKQEAEAILEDLGYENNEWWNNGLRESELFNYILVRIDGFYYEYYSHDCGETTITLEDLRIMKNQEK